MPKIAIEIKNCKECPYFKSTNHWFRTWNGKEDWIEDWICTKVNGTIEISVKYDEESKIKIPDWCPILQKD